MVDLLPPYLLLPDIPVSYSPTFTPRLTFVMSRDNVTPASHNPIPGDAPTREFANSLSPPRILRQQAAPLLTDKDLVQKVLGLATEDQKKFIDKVDHAYRTLDLQSARFVTALGDLCSAIRRLPTSAELSSGLEKCGNIAVARGGFTDTWRGEFDDRHCRRPVAIKAFRLYPAQNLKVAKNILWKRVPVWKRLSHPNILPFRGVNTTLFQLALVYDWGQNGNITQYVLSNPDAFRPSLLLDVAKGLEYLHHLGIPHGGIKGVRPDHLSLGLHLVGRVWDTTSSPAETSC